MDKVGEQLPTIGITAAGLTLVFLGFLFASWDGYDAEAKAKLRTRYRCRGWLAFAGIAASLVAVVLGLIGIGTLHRNRRVDVVGVICLGVWAITIAMQAIVALMDIER